MTATELATGRIPADPFLLRRPDDHGRPDPLAGRAPSRRGPTPTSRSEVAGRRRRRGHRPAGGTTTTCAAFADRMEAPHRALRARASATVILARHVLARATCEAADANLVGGDISGGTAQLHQQLVFRPIPGLARAETPVARPLPGVGVGPPRRRRPRRLRRQRRPRRPAARTHRPVHDPGPQRGGVPAPLIECRWVRGVPPPQTQQHSPGSAAAEGAADGLAVVEVHVVGVDAHLGEVVAAAARDVSGRRRRAAGRTPPTPTAGRRPGR